MTGEKYTLCNSSTFVGAFVRNCKHEEVKIPLSDVFVPFCGILGIDKPIWEIP